MRDDVTDIVITCLLTSQPDPQRGGHMASDVSILEELIGSVVAHGRDIVVLNDCLDEADREHVDFVRVEPGGNPYFHRWRVIADYLAAHPEFQRVWCVDGTDVEMLHDPFASMTVDWLHVGSDPFLTGVDWMRENHPGVADFIDDFADETLLNAGIVGGPNQVVAGLAELVAGYESQDTDLTDMGAFNRAMRTSYRRFATGPAVHSLLHAWDRDAPAWWRHK